MSKNDRMVGISRRTLVKSTAIGSLALAAGGFSLPFTLRSAAATVQQASEKVIWGACSVNCGSRCALRLHVKDNEVTWVETDNTGSDEYGNHQGANIEIHLISNFLQPHNRRRIEISPYL